MHTGTYSDDLKMGEYPLGGGNKDCSSVPCVGGGCAYPPPHKQQAAWIPRQLTWRLGMGQALESGTRDLKGLLGGLDPGKTGIGAGRGVGGFLQAAGWCNVGGENFSTGASVVDRLTELDQGAAMEPC